MANHLVLFLVGAIVLCINCVNATNPGVEIAAFGTTLDTSSIITKLQSALHNYDHTYGRAIHHKQDGSCMDGSWLSQSTDLSNYLVVPAKNCDYSNPVQQWRINGNTIEVASQHYLSRLHGTPCLDCFNSESDCDMLAYQCSGNSNQGFFLRVHKSQIDLLNKRIYFAIHNSLFPNRCLTRFYKAFHKTEVFHLQECTGSTEQSFYLDLDLSREVEDILTKLMATGHSLEEIYLLAD